MSMLTHVHEHPYPCTLGSMTETMNKCDRGRRATLPKASGKVGQGFRANFSYADYFPGMYSVTFPDLVVTSLLDILKR